MSLGSVLSQTIRRRNMKSVFVSVLIGILFFLLGYFYALKEVLSTELVEITSESMSRSFIERGGVYKLLSEGRVEDARLLMEVLLKGDIMLIDEMDLIGSRSGDIFCRQLDLLRNTSSGEVVFGGDVDGLLEKCSVESSLPLR